MSETKRVSLKEAAKPILNILESRREDKITTDEEMFAKISEHLSKEWVKIALYNGDDPKSWYNPLSKWKKQKVDAAYSKWKANQS